MRLKRAHIRISAFRICQTVLLIPILKSINKAIHKTISRYTVEENDIVVSITGTIGKIALVAARLAGANLTENAARSRSHPGFDIRPDYLVHVLQSAEVQSQISTATGQVRIGKLALFRIEQLALPVIEESLQIEFVRQIKALAKLLKVSKKHLEKLDELFASLQHQAFRGEL